MCVCIRTYIHVKKRVGVDLNDANKHNLITLHTYRRLLVVGASDISQYIYINYINKYYKKIYYYFQNQTKTKEKLLINNFHIS